MIDRMNFSKRLTAAGHDCPVFTCVEFENSCLSSEDSLNKWLHLNPPKNGFMIHLLFHYHSSKILYILYVELHAACFICYAWLLCTD